MICKNGITRASSIPRLLLSKLTRNVKQTDIKNDGFILHKARLKTIYSFGK